MAAQVGAAGGKKAGFDDGDAKKYTSICKI
jgi:hypothetical protein